MRGRFRRLTSVSDLCSYKPGEKSRLIDRPRTHLLFKGARKCFSCKTIATSWCGAHIHA
ncbi:hypothetical protein OG462_44030 [Streptomyces sp. NBC_01077]|uniref:hypothetical protein n=1 Tax=Streptomyces sp. NBC_01077 TaxID=2903746 RepID=UPI003866C880|nr:hypothetical protein OG462_00975 [Streptomyces sp. NBC_01077]WSV43701.1 hypothetical protein OG462_44030 [Streptomyces sp. NBC_01077]